MADIKVCDRCGNCRFAVAEEGWYLCQNSRKSKKFMVQPTHTCKYGEPREEKKEDCVMSETVQPTARWVPVSENLPEPFVRVLVFRDGEIKIDYHEENGWFAFDFNGKRATHWMPIPKPPNEGKAYRRLYL